MLNSGELRVSGVTKRFAAVEVLRGADLVVAPGRIVALLGPSGSGKTTLLRMIAGLERPDAGTITLGDTVLTAPGTFVAPERRRIGMVFQDGALFPHLTVGENVAYGLPRQDRKGPRVGEVLAMVGLEGYADRLPGTLSGGQAQRVALARALAPRPSVLLLDEPFSNLDAALRVKVRTEVHRVLAAAGVTAVFVTHDQEEAFVLGDEVAVVSEGLVAQQATPAELYARPRSSWVATFVGDANLLAGRAEGATAHTSLGDLVLDSPAHGPVEVLVRPEQVALVEGDEAEVELVEFYGHDTVVLLRARSGESLRARVTATDVRRGDRVGLRYVGPAAVAFARGGADDATHVLVG